MLKLLLLIILTCPCVAEEFIARITFYSEDGRWGKKTASGAIASQGNTCAAERRFKFGTKLNIPALKSVMGDSTYTVQDRGKDVQSRKASKGAVPVIDIYVSSEKKVRQFAKNKNLNRVKVYVKK